MLHPVRHLILLLFSLAWANTPHAETVHIAVAANFTAPTKALAKMLEKQTGHDARLSFGATGAFYTQIKQGAPFDVLLAADDERPIRLEQEDEIVTDSRFTYAVGQLVLWSAQPDLIGADATILQTGEFNKLAIANPKLAPYGAAAAETLEKMGLSKALQPKLIVGQSIGQTFNFVATGNADLGFVALSQVRADDTGENGSMWRVPASYHAPIVQQAVVLKRAASNPAAQAWMDLLRSSEGLQLIQQYGYQTP